MRIIPIPTVTRVLLPPEAEELRYMEEAMRGVFRSFGYREVIAPALEAGSATDMPDDRQTISWMADRELPLRLSYFTGSLGPAEPRRDRRREFYRAGLEQIGEDTPAMDAEALAVLCRALEACGLAEYSIVLGEVSFMRSLLDEAGLQAEDRDTALTVLRECDLVGFADVVSRLDIPADDRDAIMETATLRGGPEILTRAKDLARGPAMEASLRRLARIFYLLTRYGLSRRVLFDFGVFRDLNHCSGIVFEVLSEDLGYPLGSGGRYPVLTGGSGKQVSAAGFALRLDYLHIAASAGGGVELETRKAAVLLGGLDDSLDMADRLREAGIDVFSMPIDTDADRARQLAEQNGIPFIISIREDGLRLSGVAGGETCSLQLDGLLEAMGAGPATDG